MKYNTYKYLGLLGICLGITVESCKVPAINSRTENKAVPESYADSRDTTNIANIKWHDFFKDAYLSDLIDTALLNNKELMVTMQDIEIARNDIRVRKGAILPSISLGAGAGIEKVGKYTSQGAGDASTDIEPGKAVPDWLPNLNVGLTAEWEVDIWKKLHNAKKAAVMRYLSTVEGKNFVLTNLIAEVANSYYELLAYDNQLAIVKQNIDLQKNALKVIKIQKDAARETELAVQKFQAEVLKSQSLEFEIMQNIKESENNINFLLGRFPQKIARENKSFFDIQPNIVQSGIPSQLLANRADIRQAEQDLMASKLDIKIARAEFYPSFSISAGLGFEAFSPRYLFRLPESLLGSLAGDIAGPLINRNAIKAEYSSANAKQLQAAYNYERTILNAYVEVSNQLSKIENLKKSYDLKSQQVDALTNSIGISNDLFKSARANYMEVLMTQRDALDAKMELIETRKQQLSAVVNTYKALGGGWK